MDAETMLATESGERMVRKTHRQQSEALPKGIYERIIYRKGRPRFRTGVYWIRYADSTGKIRREKVGTRSAATKLYHKRKTEVMEGRKLPENLRQVKMPTLQGFSQRFINQISMECARKPQTVRFYTQQMTALSQFPRLADARLCDIDEALIDEFKAYRAATTSTATVNRGLATLRRALRLAQRWKVIDRLPQIKLLANERRREFVLSRELEGKYLTASPQPLRDCALLMLDTGLRVGEALGLEWRDVCLSPEPGFVQVREGKSRYSQRAVPLTSRSRGMLAVRRDAARSVNVFAEDGNGPMLNTSLAHMHVKVRRTLGLNEEFVLHSLRHTFCTRLGEEHAEAFLIQRLAGHHSVTVSERYVHPTPESAIRAIGLLDAANKCLSGNATDTRTDTATLALP